MTETTKFNDIEDEPFSNPTEGVTPEPAAAEETYHYHLSITLGIIPLIL